MKTITNLIRIVFLGLFIFLFVQGKVMLWLGLFAISLVAALIFGRIYCSYACPMNTLMIPVDSVSKKLHLQKSIIPKWAKSGYVPWIALILSVAVMIVAKRVLQIDVPILLFWLLVAVVFTIRYKPAVFHNLICPFGPLQKMFGRFARRTKYVVREACIGCRLCEKVCPSDAIAVSSLDKKAHIDTSFCHQCPNCSDICPKNAIRYGNSAADAS